MLSISLRKLETEIARVKALYLTTRYSFKQTSQVIAQCIKSGEIDPKAPVLSNPANPESVLSNNAYALQNRLHSQFPRYLRETIFVRLISSLEVYLIDVIRDIFLSRRDLFHSQNRIEFSVGEILSAESLVDLWTKLINNELRKVQNQGFNEITKFCKNRFDIDFNRFRKPVVTLQEYHDRRHILVHRLGLADNSYRHKYNTTLKNLPITEEYLLNAFKNILEFAQFVNAEAVSLIQTAPDKTKAAKPEVRRRIVLEVLSDEAKTVTSRDYHFSVEEGIGCLGDILRSYQYEEPKHLLVLEGSRAEVRSYLNILKKLVRRKQITLYDTENIESRNVSIPKECTLPREIVETIARTLPHRPWPKFIHKQIAVHLGLSNSQVSAAISVILAADDLAAMIGGNDAIKI